MFLKQFISFISHPLLYIKIYVNNPIVRKGYFILRGRINIKKVKYIQFGKNIEICNNARILCVDNFGGKKYFPRIIIGNNIFIGYNFSLLSAAEIRIEDNVLIASNVLISSENHGMNPLITNSYGKTPLDVKPVHIKDGCWLGEKSMIMPGVTLGKRCIVAAGAVVTKSFPDYCLLAGVPAKCIKIFDLNSQSWVSVKSE